MASRKGVPNKIGAQAKENVVAVFTRLGGTAAMAEWARENQTEFYKLYARLIPTEMTATIDIRDTSELSNDELARELTEVRAALAGTTQSESGEGEPSGVH